MGKVVVVDKTLVMRGMSESYLGSAFDASSATRTPATAPAGHSRHGDHFGHLHARLGKETIQDHFLRLA